MWSQHLHTRFSTFFYILLLHDLLLRKSVARLLSRVTFRIKSETEFDETCLMQIFMEVENVLGKCNTKHIKY